ncbi:uncharacterized protein Fot_10735 [Forsythia ovata]|uniref:Uncharacterized protein n=1 Tax=Forsythia ovata TaxID=205694 RepID=A0ABD1WIC4_9LAMI
MLGRTRRRPRIEHPDAPLQEMEEEQQPPLQIATVQHVTILQNQMSTIIEMLQRITAPNHTSEVPSAPETPLTAEPPVTTEVSPAAEIPSSENMQAHETTSTSHYSIPANWESILNEKVDEAIARRKNRGRPISIKEDPFTDDVMSVPLPSKFKEPTRDFVGTIDPIDHIRTF